MKSCCTVTSENFSDWIVGGDVADVPLRSFRVVFYLSPSGLVYKGGILFKASRYQSTKFARSEFFCGEESWDGLS